MFSSPNGIGAFDTLRSIRCAAEGWVQDAAWEIAGFGVTFKRMHQSNRNKVPQPKNPVHSDRVPRGTAP